MHLALTRSTLLFAVALRSCPASSDAPPPPEHPPQAIPPPHEAGAHHGDGGTTCEEAVARYREELRGREPPDAGPVPAYSAVLDRGSYLNPCKVPNSMGVVICAAVREGRVVGVTVTTSPDDAAISACVAAQVRSLAFPGRPGMDVARTTFAPSN